MPGRAMIVTRPGAADIAPALLAEGWSVERCAADQAAARIGDDVELVACPLTCGDGDSGARLLAEILDDHPEAGGLLYADEMPAGAAEALTQAPGVPVVRPSACPTLIRLAVYCALTRPHA